VAAQARLRTALGKVAGGDPVAIVREVFAIAIGRLHRMAGDFQCIRVFIFDGREGNLVPAVANRKTGSFEISGLARLGKPDHRDRLPGRGTAAVGDQSHEDIDRGACRRGRNGPTGGVADNLDQAKEAFRAACVRSRGSGRKIVGPVISADDPLRT
jgi:hypothetical protein